MRASQCAESFLKRGVLADPGSLAAVRVQQRRSAAGKSMKDCLRDNIFIR